jgi:hypothetical protein
MTIDDKKDVTDFRRWLVGKVAITRWPVRKGDTDETMGKRLGVQPDVLAEARSVMQRTAPRTYDGRARKLGMPRAGDGKAARFQMFLEPPEEVYRDWCAYRDRRQLTNAILLRSVIGHMLTLSSQPTSLHSGKRAWRYKGHWSQQANIRAHAYRMKTYLDEPTYRALMLRAEKTSVAAAALARWAVVSLLEGKLERPGKNLRIVTGLDSLYIQGSYITTPTLVKE